MFTGEKNQWNDAIRKLNIVLNNLSLEDLVYEPRQIFSMNASFVMRELLHKKEQNQCLNLFFSIYKLLNFLYGFDWNYWIPPRLSSYRGKWIIVGVNQYFYSKNVQRVLKFSRKKITRTLILYFFYSPFRELQNKMYSYWKLAPRQCVCQVASIRACLVKFRPPI